MKSLDNLKKHDNGTIDSLTGSGLFLNRAASMGFVPGTDVVVVRNQRRGPLIVRLKDTDIAIGRKEAGKICVREISQ